MFKKTQLVSLGFTVGPLGFSSSRQEMEEKFRRAEEARREREEKKRREAARLEEERRKEAERKLEEDPRSLSRCN